MSHWHDCPGCDGQIEFQGTADCGGCNLDRNLHSDRCDDCCDREERTRIPTLRKRAEWILCPRCEGEGRHVNPAVDGHGLSWEDFDEQGPEFMEDYFSGVYDVTCEMCNGLRVIDDSEEAREERAYEAERRHEIEMGY